MGTAVQFLVIALMLGLNGVFAAYEMALASVSRARLHALAGRKARGAADAVFMKDRMEASLAVVQLGITLVGAIAAATGGVSASESIAPWLGGKFGFSDMWAEVTAVMLFVLPLSGVTIIFAELVPKMIALNHREKVCLRLSPFMKGLFHFFHPVVNVLEFTVKRLVAIGSRRITAAVRDEDPGLHELQAAAALARTSRLIGAHQEKILLSAAQLSTRPVREILIPAVDLCTIPVSATLSQALVKAHMDMHTRFPVCRTEGDPQTIDGYVNFKDIIAALRINPQDPSIHGIVRPLKRVEADRSISYALELMMQEKLHIVLVTGRNGEVAGMVALEDIIEELVGEIEDEFDRLPGYMHPFAGGVIAGGGIPMESLSRVLGLKAEFPAHERLTDWCVRRASGALEGGQVIEADGLRVTLRKFRRHKVGEAAVSLFQNSV